jgi:hypothetical protein
MEKDKIKINISKENQANLDNLRRELVSFISRTNDLELMKRLEKCSYDRLIFLLNIGFSEKSMFETLNGTIEISNFEAPFTDKAKEILNILLDKEIKEDKEDEMPKL